MSDLLHYSWQSLRSNLTRTLLILLAMSISVASVLLLTALGDGARNYVTGEFAALGTNLVIVLPGKSETSGSGLNTMMGATPRDLTLDDARALERHPQVKRIAVLNIGAVEMSYQNRKREVAVIGSNNELLTIRHWELLSGQFLPKTDWDRAPSVCVIGKKLRDELFGAHQALGQWIRLGENRYRVIGIMKDLGKSLDINVSESVIIPVAAAQSLMNTPSLFRILIETRSRESMPAVIEFASKTIKQRHFGKEDVTVITQDSIIDTFDNILSSLTYAVAGIAAISLLVSGILIMNVMLVSVSQRTEEIGLLKALGASQQRILLLILNESLLLSIAGILTGYLLGYSGCFGLQQAFPELDAWPPLWSLLAALCVALITAVAFSWLPARKAAELDPVEALSGH